MYIYPEGGQPPGRLQDLAALARQEGMYIYIDMHVIYIYACMYTYIYIYM